MRPYYQGNVSVSLDHSQTFQWYSEAVWVFPKDVFQTQMLPSHKAGTQKHVASLQECCCPGVQLPVGWKLSCKNGTSTNTKMFPSQKASTKSICSLQGPSPRLCSLFGDESLGVNFLVSGRDGRELGRY